VFAPTDTAFAAYVAESGKSEEEVLASPDLKVGRFRLPQLKAPGTKRLKLKYDELPSRFGFKFNLRRYIEEILEHHIVDGKHTAAQLLAMDLPAELDCMNGAAKIMIDKTTEGSLLVAGRGLLHSSTSQLNLCCSWSLRPQ